MPVIIEAYKKLKLKPNIIICDGQGIAHPRRFGLACHLGIELDMVTIGCAKSLLVGSYDDLETTRGSQKSIICDEERIGIALRTQNNINPIFVSVGHKISLETACKITLSMATRYRLPETTRLADKFARKSLTEHKM